MEEEFGRPLNEDLALWFLRNRIQREAIERMLGDKPENLTMNEGAQNTTSREGDSETSATETLSAAFR